METIKKNQSEMKDTLTEIKNNLQGVNSRVKEAKNQNSDLEYKEAKYPIKKKIPPNGDNVRSLQDKFKCARS